MWADLRRPELRPLERLFFECYARAAQGEAPFTRLLPAAVRGWLDAADEHTGGAVDPGVRPPRPRRHPRPAARPRRDGRRGGRRRRGRGVRRPPARRAPIRPPGERHPQCAARNRFAAEPPPPRRPFRHRARAAAPVRCTTGLRSGRPASEARRRGVDRRARTHHGVGLGPARSVPARVHGLACTAASSPTTTSSASSRPGRLADASAQDQRGSGRPSGTSSADSW